MTMSTRTRLTPVLVIMMIALLHGPLPEPAAAATLTGCDEKLGCLRFLWPADPAAPGGKEIELTARPTQPGPAAAGAQDVQSYELAAPDGTVVATTTRSSLPLGPGFTATVLETTILLPITAPTGAFAQTHFALPALTPPASHRRVLCFKEDAFAPPTEKPVAATGPAALYSDDLDVIVISPLDHFLVAINAPAGKEWRSGFEGLIEQIPAGTVHRVLIVTGRGMNATFAKWGEALRGAYKHERQALYADVAVSYLGYWTDNGAIYYYKTAPGLNYHQTLIAVRDDARARGIPYGYFQLDSWWYPKATGDEITSAFRGGSLLWEPIAEMFPSGLPEFQRELGLPLVAHNRWYAESSPYCARYQCEYGHGGKKPALPVEPRFWDEIMDNAVKYGVKVYEQDWLVTQMDLIPWLRAGINNADEKWFDVMANKAADRGLTMQLCMASPGFFLQQIKHPNVTHVRCSNDYQAGILKDYYWPNFHRTSMLAYAVGLWPFKDNFQSASGQRLGRNERRPFEEALISNLSAGPVGPADKIGAADPELLRRTCRQDGVLLKPDRPALPIDLMYLDSAKPWIVTTESKPDLGAVTYLAAFNIRPAHTRDRSVTLADLGLAGPHVIYDWRNHTVSASASDRVAFGPLKTNAASYHVLAPILPNGMAVIGEPDKFVTMSQKRFPAAHFADNRLTLEIEGVPDEPISVLLYTPTPPRRVEGAEATPGPAPMLTVLKLAVPPSGRTRIMVE
jgi:hypothetical protein